MHSHTPQIQESERLGIYRRVVDNRQNIENKERGKCAESSQVQIRTTMVTHRKKNMVRVQRPAM